MQHPTSTAHRRGRVRFDVSPRETTVTFRGDVAYANNYLVLAAALAIPTTVVATIARLVFEGADFYTPNLGMRILETGFFAGLAAWVGCLVAIPIFAYLYGRFVVTRIVLRLDGAHAVRDSPLGDEVLIEPNATVSGASIHHDKDTYRRSFARKETTVARQSYLTIHTSNRSPNVGYGLNMKELDVLKQVLEQFARQQEARRGPRPPVVVRIRGPIRFGA